MCEQRLGLCDPLHLLPLPPVAVQGHRVNAHGGTVAVRAAAVELPESIIFKIILSVKEKIHYLKRSWTGLGTVLK